MDMTDMWPPQVQEEYRPQRHKDCAHCEKPIFLSDRAIYIHHGELGSGRKSGQPIVVDSDHTTGDAILHEGCALAYMVRNIVDSSDDLESLIDDVTVEHFGISYSELAQEEDLCAACEAKLDE